MQNSFLVFALSKMKIQNKRSCLKQTNDLFYVSFGGEGGLEEWLVTNFRFSAFVYSFFSFLLHTTANYCTTLIPILPSVK